MTYEITPLMIGDSHGATRGYAYPDAPGYDLPALTGSERQIEWADAIRHAVAVAIEAQIADHRARPADAPTRFAADERWIAAARGEIVRQTQATWWINHRNGSAVWLVRGEGAESMAEE